jgi:LacI family transcriptional regulator
MSETGKRIALVMHNWVGYLYGVQQGIADYVLHQPNWTWIRTPPVPELLAGLFHADLDGVIAYVETPYVSLLKRLKVPVVCVSNWEDTAPFPHVLPDDVAIGKLAARHLIDLGLKHFGYVGFPGAKFSELRRKGFAAGLAEESFQAEYLQTKGRNSTPLVEVAPGVNRLTADWLKKLPKPAGVFATSDSAAAEILEVCRHNGIRVPDEICVLGVDNDDLVHRFSHPPLSSIALPTQKVGLEAAKLLDSLMAGHPPPTRPMLLPPIGVITRQSTNLLAISDEDVLAAVRYIREHVRDRITVGHILREVAISRRQLERKFAESFGRTPLQEIQRVRIEKAKELLSGTDLPMPAIASRSGFKNAERLARVFRSTTDQTPTEYRRKF